MTRVYKMRTILRRARGLCVGCGRPTGSPAYASCETCARRAAYVNALVYARRRASGQCAFCGVPSDRTRCPVCRAVETARQRDRRQRAREACRMA